MACCGSVNDGAEEVNLPTLPPPTSYWLSLPHLLMEAGCLLVLGDSPCFALCQYCWCESSKQVEQLRGEYQIPFLTVFTGRPD